MRGKEEHVVDADPYSRNEVLTFSWVQVHTLRAMGAARFGRGF